MPPIEIPEKWKEYGSILTRGLTIQAAPEITAGALLFLLRKKKVDVKTVVRYVREKRSLLDDFSDEELKRLKGVFRHIHNVDWLNYDWLLTTLQKDYPAIASLLVSWKPATNWAEKQVVLIKEYFITE